MDIIRREMKSAGLPLSSREINRARRKAKILARQKSMDVSECVSMISYLGYDTNPLLDDCVQIHSCYLFFSMGSPVILRHGIWGKAMPFF